MDDIDMCWLSTSQIIINVSWHSFGSYFVSFTFIFLAEFYACQRLFFSFGNSLNLALRGTSKHNREVVQFHQTWNLMKNDQYFLGRRTKFGCYVSNRLCELKGGCCIGQNSMKPKWEKQHCSWYWKTKKSTIALILIYQQTVTLPELG